MKTGKILNSPAALVILAAVPILAQYSFPPSRSGANASLGTPTTDVRLASVMSKLTATATSVFNVVFIGDSMSICSMQNCTNTGPNDGKTLWTTQLATFLTSRYGSHGTGIIPMASGIQPTNLNTPTWTLGQTQNVNNAGGPTEYGNGSTYLLNNNEYATISPHYGDTVRIYRAIGGTTCGSGFSVAFDQPGTVGQFVSAGTFGTATAAGLAYDVVTVPITGGLGWHSTRIQSLSTTCFPFGIEYTIGSTGVSAHNVSMGSCQSACWGDTSTSSLAQKFAYTDLIPGGTQLAIVALGTNDAFNSTAPATYQANLTNIVTHEQSLGATVIIMNEPWIPGSPIAASQVPLYAAAATVAASTGAILYDPTTSLWVSYANELSLGWSTANYHFNNTGQTAWGLWTIQQMFGIAGPLTATCSDAKGLLLHCGAQPDGSFSPRP